MWRWGMISECPSESGNPSNTAAAALVLSSAGGYVYHRGQRATLATEHLRLIVTGPSALQAGSPKARIYRSTSVLLRPRASAILRAGRLRSALLSGADLRGADLRFADLAGADLRGADLSGADLRDALFVAQSQLEAANGAPTTRLPSSRTRPGHWVGVAPSSASPEAPEAPAG